MSSSIRWDDNGNLGPVANIGEYTLFVFQLAVISTSLEFMWGVVRRDDDILHSKDFQENLLNHTKHPAVLKSGKFSIQHNMTLIRAAHGDIIAQKMKEAKEKAETAFNEIDVTRLAEEAFLKDE